MVGHVDAVVAVNYNEHTGYDEAAQIPSLAPLFRCVREHRQREHHACRMPVLSVEDAAKVIRNAYDLGVTFFDHATCYGNGEAEQRFGDAFPQTGLKREDVFLQGKVGLCFDRNEFDWTKENILSSVDDSLRRLRTDYLDAVLLHRPDVIFEPEEVAEAFQKLADSGKVKYFGVSNLMPMQIELLKKYVRQPLVFNQVQLSL